MVLICVDGKSKVMDDGWVGRRRGDSCGIGEEGGNVRNNGTQSHSMRTQSIFKGVKTVL
jgi:hypothetical protein